MHETGLDFSDVILSGGTGRSGTTIIGKLLSRHSQVGLSRPAEIKMLTYGNGLLDLYLGKRVGRYKRLLITDRLHLERFRYRLFNDWWERDPKVGEIAGLIQGIELEELKTLYSKMKSDWKLNRKLAPANFLRAFVETQKRASGKPLWIDTTPINLFRSNELAPFLPGARFIHMVRDGRDVISSVTREHWGPRTYDEGLTWYRRRMRRILLNTNELDSRVLTISLEDLAIHNRSESLDTILSFLGLESESKLQKYFEAEVTPEKVSRGRWQEEVADVKKFNESYLEIVAELKAIDPSVPLES
jgi:hypothetical protein